MADNSRLRALIYGRFKSQTEMAKALGWSQQRLNRALKNPNKLQIDQYLAILDCLGAENTPETMSIFFNI